MSKKCLETAVGKVILDDEFRTFLFADPDRALAAFNLSPAETVRLKRLDDETLEFVAKILHARLDGVGQDSSISQSALGKSIPTEEKEK